MREEPVLDVRRLRVLMAVAEEGSFTAAAQRLFLTQSAVSQQMSLLEREVGVQLLRRLPRGVELTPVGEVLVERAAGILRDVADLGRDLRTLAGDRREIRVGAFTSSGAELLPLVLRRLAQQHPDIDVVLIPAVADDAAARLRGHEVDVALAWEYDFAPQPEDIRLARLRLPDDPLRVILPAGHRYAVLSEVPLADLADERWVVRAHRGRYVDAYELMCGTAGFEPNIVLRTEDYPSMQGFIAAGLGVGVAPALSLAPHRDDVVIRPMAGAGLSRRIVAHTLPQRGDDPIVRAFLTALEAVAREILPGDPPID